MNIRRVKNSGALKVLDVNGDVLLKLEGVKPTVEAAGIYIYNRGQDLNRPSVKSLSPTNQDYKSAHRRSQNPRLYDEWRNCAGQTIC